MKTALSHISYLISDRKSGGANLSIYSNGRYNLIDLCLNRKEAIDLARETTRRMQVTKLRIHFEK